MSYTVTDGARIEASLTGLPGDPVRGAALYADAEQAGCTVCHGIPGEPRPAELRAALPDGRLAVRPVPALDDVGARLVPGAIRLWIVAPRALDPESAMPGFYRAGQRLGADDPLYGGPRLTAAEIEDLVAYLVALDGSR